MSEIKKEYYNQTGAEQKTVSRWWTVKEAVHSHLFPVVEHIEKKQNYRRSQNLRHARLYSDLDILGMQFAGAVKPNSDSKPGSRISLNVIKSCIDTIAAKIAKAKPRPMFLTEGGNYKTQKQAKQLTKYMDGAFDKMDIYKKAPLSFVDSCVFGTGGLKFYIDEPNKMIDCDRVFIDEIIVDDVEGIYGNPRQLHQKRYINRDVLIDMFPKSTEQITACSSAKGGDADGRSTQDLLCVIESWHLRSGRDARDGMHTICIENCDLWKKEWKKDYFPFVFLRWTPRLMGFFGMGLAEELTGLQVEVNKLLRSIQQAQHLIAVPRVWVENNSQVNTSHINNEIGAVGKYSGQAPIFQTATAMSPEVYQHLERLIRYAYEFTGVSMLSAQAKKPAGLDSGVAMREYQDIESERFQLQGVRYEDFFVEACDIVADLTEDLSKITKDLSVVTESGKFAEEIKWAEVNMNRDKLVLRCFPTSILPTSPAGKLQTVQELMQAGILDRETGLDLLDFPDTDAAISRKLAPTRIISKMINEMVETGEYIPPEPFLNLALALEYSQETYLDLKMQGLEEDKLELIRTFMSDIQALQTQTMPPPMPGGAGMPPGAGAPMANPTAPPVSDLIPNVPAAG